MLPTQPIPTFVQIANFERRVGYHRQPCNICGEKGHEPRVSLQRGRKRSYASATHSDRGTATVDASGPSISAVKRSEAVLPAPSHAPQLR